MSYKVAVSKNLSRGEFLAESPANPGRGLESTRFLTLAKWDFVDQTAVDDYVDARGGVVGAWIVLDLSAAGVT